jgi:hypothetical protein
MIYAPRLRASGCERNVFKIEQSAKFLADLKDMEDIIVGILTFAKQGIQCLIRRQRTFALPMQTGFNSSMLDEPN